MNDFDLATLAHDAREQVHTGPPPLEAITAPPPRHPIRWIALFAAAVVATVVVAVAVSHQSSSDRSPSATPTPPLGTRWVGAGHVLVAVPVSWADSQYGCENEPRPAVVYDVDYWSNCQASPLGRERRPASLWVSPRTDAYDDELGARRATIAVPAVSGWRSEPWWADAHQGGYWYETLETNDAIFVAQASSRAAVQTMIASARRTQDVVPVSIAGDDLEDARQALAGYDVDVSWISSPFRVGSVFASEPEFGTPQGAGSTVTLMVSSGLGGTQAIPSPELRRHGILMEPAGSYPAGVADQIEETRRDLRIDLAGYPSPWDRQLLLRRVTATGMHDRLAWMVLEPGALTESSSGECCGQSALGSVVKTGGVVKRVSLYDALTGRLLESKAFR